MRNADFRSGDTREGASTLLRELRPVDDVFARNLFRDEPRMIQKIMRTILDDDELVLKHMETQRDLKQLSGARSVVMDVYAEDTRDRRYNLEFEKSRTGADPKRARFHGSVLDGRALLPGEKFEAIRDSRVIFLTSYDYYGLGFKWYDVRRMIFGTNRFFGDGLHIRYVNGSYRGEDPFGRLMHDLCCCDPEDMYDKELAELEELLEDSTDLPYADTLEEDD